jgi:hypothetical protein
MRRSPKTLEMTGDRLFTMITHLSLFEADPIFYKIVICWVEFTLQRENTKSQKVFKKRKGVPSRHNPILTKYKPV